MKLLYWMKGNVKMDKFLKSDLHVHSSSCFSRGYGKEEFIETVKATDLNVISITDHNIIDVDLYKELISDTSFKQKLIGGVELNISIDTETINRFQLITSGDYFHAIIWFDIDDLDIAWASLQNLITDLEPAIETNEKELSLISREMDGRSFTLKSVQEEFSKMDYYFLFHENKGSRNLSDYLPNDDKDTGQQLEANQDYKARMFYYNNAMAMEGGVKSRRIKNFFEKDLKTLVAAFLFSDAKTLDEIGTKYTWINFDGRFSSLILPISDPTCRVFTSDNNPENPQVNRNNYLSGIKIYLHDSGGNEIEKLINFSPGLNGIIGARGDGKSMLGNLIAKENADTYKNFVNHDRIEYVLADGSTTRAKQKCKYLKQKSLYQIYENTNYNELDLLKKFYKELTEQNENAVEEALTLIGSLFDELQKIIETLYGKYLGQPYPISVLKDELSPTKLLNNFEDSSIENFVGNFEKLEGFFIKYQKLWKQSQEDIDLLVFDSTIPELNSFAEDVEENKGLIKEHIDEIIILVNSLLEDIKQKKPLSRDRQKLIKKYISLLGEINREIDFAGTRVKGELSQLKNFFIDILTARINCLQISRKIDDAYTRIATYMPSKNLRFDGNEIKIAIERDCKLTYEDVVREYIKNEAYTPDILITLLLEAENFLSVSEKIKKTKFRNIDNFTAFTAKLFSKVDEDIGEIENANMHLYFNDKDLQDLSPGKRSEILLRILLDPAILGNEYLFIILDQPDDDLDTKTINDFLVRKIKEMKLEMQFFVISHSAAVIVNGDADVIILAESDTNDGIQVIDYSEGKINTLNMKEKIATILDGGELNLKTRLNKYDFNYEEKVDA